MKTPRFSALTAPLLITLGIVLLSACNPKCQVPSDVKKTFTGVTWRLVNTTNPNIKNNDRFSFLLFEADQGFSGKIRKVVNNREFETPVKIFRYNLTTGGARDGRIRIAFSDPPAEEDGGNSGGSQDNGESQFTEVTDYEWSVGTKFELTETQTGYYYLFYPYEGIVDPASNCTY